MALPVAAIVHAAMPDQPLGVHIEAAQLDTPASQKRANYEYHVLAGEMAIQRGKRALAAREYVAALAYSNDVQLAERATRVAVYANQRDLAFTAVKVWAAGAPKSLDAQHAATRLAFLVGDKQALARFAPALVAAAASPKAGYRMLAQLLAGDPQHADLAIATVGKLAQQHPHSAPAQYALGVIALGYDRVKIAAPAAAAARKLTPDASDAALLQAGVWISQGRPQAAQRLVSSLSGDAAKRARYHSALAGLLVHANDRQAARHEFARAVKLAPGDADARYGLAVVCLAVGDLDRAQAAFEKLYKNDHKVADAAYYLGSIHEQHQQYAKAQSWYQRVHEGDHAFAAQLRAARMIDAQGNLDAARKRLNVLRKRYPDQSGRLFAAEGQLLFEAGRYKRALGAYNRGLAGQTDSLDLYYGRSIVYERLGRVAAAEADLKTMLKRNANDPRALNALGYMLTNHSRHYHKALAYIRKALHADPHNPAIEDSMGWVQYRLGHLAVARRYLEKAYAKQADPEIAAHLGEVRWQQGAHAAARTLWQDARAANPKNAVLRTTIKRYEQ